MAFMIPKNPESPKSTPTSSYEEDRPNITSYVTLRPQGGDTSSSWAARPPLEKEMVLRRIRHRKRINRLHDALQSFLLAPVESGKEGRQSAGGWLDDAFSP